MISTKLTSVESWMQKRIKNSQIEKYLTHGRDFINDAEILYELKTNINPDHQQINDILNKSLSIQTLTADETACLLNVKDQALWEKMYNTAYEVKKKVYDNRIVFFAPLYLSNLCVNNCLYCGFRNDNKPVTRRILKEEEVKKETEILAGKIGHKRLIAVYAEHPQTGLDYMLSTINTIYNVEVKTKKGWGQIRRVNVNASPLSIEELKELKKTGIGTYQVFQETYHHKTYQTLHPRGTIKANYQWRLYCMHRALEAGIDDVGIGVLFGLYDWKFEVMGLTSHARELENRFGIGPHTISFPRLEEAANTPYIQTTKYKVGDSDFKKLMTVIRLSVPHAGMIITCRETPQMKREAITLGYTQTDASARIGIGSYSEHYNSQKGERQQFFLKDTRSLDEVVREFAQIGYITSFCTAGYRCGRTGKCIMRLLRTGEEGKFCKLNAVLTFREWLDDFATSQTRKIGKKIIAQELAEIKRELPSAYPQFLQYYKRIESGERDLYF